MKKKMDSKSNLVNGVLEVILETNNLIQNIHTSEVHENMPCSKSQFQISNPLYLQREKTKNYLKFVSDEYLKLKNIVRISSDFSNETTENLKMMKVERRKVTLQNKKHFAAIETYVKGIQTLSILEEIDIQQWYSEMKRDYDQITNEIDQITKILEERGLSRIQQDLHFYLQTVRVFPYKRKVNKKFPSSKAVKSIKCNDHSRRNCLRKKASDNQKSIQLKAPNLEQATILNGESPEVSEDNSSVLPSSDVALPSVTRFLKEYMKRKSLGRKRFKHRT